MRVQRRRLSLGLGAIVASLAACSSPLRGARTPLAPGKSLRVLSYNVNFGIPGDAPTLDAIAERPSDLVLLQETTPYWELALRERFADEFPCMRFRHCCGAGGLAVLSKYDVEELDYIEPPEGGWFPGWRLSVDSPLGALQVLNVHLRPQLGDSGATIGGVLSGAMFTPSIRREQIEAYARHLEAGVPTLVAGDFNESESGSALEWLEKRGLRSAVPDFTHDETWSWPTSVGRVSRRFDHIVYSSELIVASAGVVKAGRSDHLPVFAVIERFGRSG